VHMEHINTQTEEHEDNASEIKDDHYQPDEHYQPKGEDVHTERLITTSGHEVESDFELPARRQVNVTSFHYDVDLEGEESYANAAQISALEERNKKLLAQIDQVEDKVFASEESRLKLQRELLMAEEEAAESRSLLDLRDAQNAQLRKENDSLSAHLQEELSKLAELESDRRKIEHNKTILETQVQENKRAQARLNAVTSEMDELRNKVALLIQQKGTAVTNKERASRSLSELEHKLRAEFFRGRELNKRTVTELDSLIETERRRGQQAIDYVRKSLKAKIKQLEVQLDLNKETDLDFKKEKRRVARELKQVNRKLEEQKSQSTHNERHIESLSKQLASVKENYFDKDHQHKINLETDIANLQREVGTLTAQYDAACRINAKLNTVIGTEQNVVEDQDEVHTSSTQPVETLI